VLSNKDKHQKRHPVIPTFSFIQQLTKQHAVCVCGHVVIIFSVTPTTESYPAGDPGVRGFRKNLPHVTHHIFAP